MQAWGRQPVFGIGPDNRAPSQSRGGSASSSPSSLSSCGTPARAPRYHRTGSAPTFKVSTAGSCRSARNALWCGFKPNSMGWVNPTQGSAADHQPGRQHCRQRPIFPAALPEICRESGQGCRQISGRRNPRFHLKSFEAQMLQVRYYCQKRPCRFK